MAYQLVLKRVNEQEKREKIAVHIADMSGAQLQQILSAISTKSISLGRDFSFEKASEMKTTFEAMGAEIIMKDLSAPVEEPHHYSEEDEEDEGVLLTHAEYVKALNKRGDIFTVEKDKRLSFIMPFVFVFGLAWGFSLWSMKFVGVSEEFYTLKDKTVNVTLSDVELTIKEPKKKKEEKVIKTEKKRIRKSEARRQDRKQKRVAEKGGNIKSRVMKKGLIGAMSKQMTAHKLLDADPLGLGGTTTGIDAMLDGKGGLKKGSSNAFGKRGNGGPIGFGGGRGGGFSGGNENGINLDNLSGRDSESDITDLKPRKRKNLPKPGVKKYEQLTGGRSQASIRRTVRNNMASLKYAYNKRLKINPGMGGKIKLKWAIDQFGNVLHCRVVSSNLNDKEFEQEIVRKVRSWAFGKIAIPGDVTEVTYPFVFTQ